jgi:transposase
MASWSGLVLKAPAPTVLACAGTLQATTGDNPNRLHSEAALAALCAASPVQASSGKTTRHRLNRGGDRQANNASWVITLTRLRIDPATRGYAQRRSTPGQDDQGGHALPQTAPRP